MKIIALSLEETHLIRRAIAEYRTKLEDRNLDIQLNGREEELRWLINKNNLELAELIKLSDILLEYLID